MAGGTARTFNTESARRSGGKTGGCVEKEKRNKTNLRNRAQGGSEQRHQRHLSSDKRGERRSGGNQSLTRVKFKGVTKTEGRGYQRGLRTKR